MIETTYNGSHNLSSFYSLFYYYFWLFLSLNPPFLSSCPTAPIIWMHHRSLFNAIQAHSSCQRGSGSLEAPRCCTKSAKRRKKRERHARGKKSGDKGLVLFPPTWNLALILTVLFLACHTFMWKYQWFLPKDFGSLLNILKIKVLTLKHIFKRAWFFCSFAPVIFFFLYCLPSTSFLLLTSISPSFLIHLSS